MQRGAHRTHPLPAQPARRAGPADRGHVRARRLVGQRSRHRGAGQRQLCRPVRRRAHQRARPARRALPVRRVRRAAPAHRVGPHRRHAAGSGRVPAARGHQRRHHPRPWALRRVPAGRCTGGRARRGDGLREPGGGDVHPRRDDVAHRGHHPRPRDRHASSGHARQDAVLARRRAGPPARAGYGRGCVPAGDPFDPGRRRPTNGLAESTSSTSSRRSTCWPTSTSRPRPPAPCPTTAPSSWSGSGTRSATGASACSAPSVRRCMRRGPSHCG